MTVSCTLKLSDPDIFKATMKFQQRAPDLFNRKVPSAARRVTAFAKRTMPEATPPDPRPKFPGRPYPLPWTSLRQRRAYFATNGFGGGIPYTRSGRLMQNWQTSTNTEQGGNGFFELINPAPQARYVLGADQQFFLRRIGWPNLLTDDVPALDKVQEFANEQIERLFYSMIEDYLK